MAMKRRLMTPLALALWGAWLAWSACLGQAPPERPGPQGDALAGKGLIRHIQDTTPPIGAIVAWHKAFAHQATPPRGWVECNGQEVPYGPMAGRKLPDLNGERRFLRGGTTSGICEQDEFQGHTHRMAEKSDGEHEHALEGVAWSQPQNVQRALNDNGRQNYSGFMKEPWPSHGLIKKTTKSGAHTHSIGGPSRDKTYGEPRVGSETRPVNMSVVWIMRIE
jgi:hypothetical protein